MGKAIILRNAASRPVELHLADRFAVMLPGDKLTLEQPDLSDPGVRPLVQSGVLTVFEAPAEPPPKPAGSRKRPAKAASPPKPKDVAAKPAPQAKKGTKTSQSPPAPASKPETKGQKKQEPKKQRRLPTTPNQTETSR